ncbi:MAG TPA: hypothetical protein VN893_06170 [Bryobacteraceae bacterium]|nr:hypothetical protein [Bryobacteraceae bacterium]
MTRIMLALVLLSAAAAPLAADKDFLTSAEVDQVRLAQEPNDRLRLYIEFARQRLDQLKQLVKESRPGRAVMIHDLLDEYGQIIDAIDTVSDDALARKVDISLGAKAVGGAEKGFLPMLEKIRDSHPSDIERYDFVLTQAIQATSDSMETANEDPGKRSAEVTGRLKKEEKEREAEMTPAEADAKKKQAQDAAKQPKKPTLLKPGETVVGQEPPPK